MKQLIVVEAMKPLQVAEKAQKNSQVRLERSYGHYPDPENLDRGKKIAIH